MANEIKKVDGKYLTYMGQPLVREGNTLCYGDKSEKYFLILDIMSYKKEGDTEVPNQVFISVVESANPANSVKQGSKPGLSDALELGKIWLDLMNNKK